MRFILAPFYILYSQPDKLGHLLLFGGFGFFLYFTLKSSSNPLLKNYAFLLAIIIGTIYSVTDEFHQYFVPGRTANLWDVIAGSIGLVISQIIIFALEKIDHYRKKIWRNQS